MLERPTFWHLKMSWGYLIANVCFSTSQPCLQHEYTTWMLMLLIPFVMVLGGLPNFTIIFMNYHFNYHATSHLSLEFTRKFLLSCVILTYLCKLHNGVVFFVGSPVVMRQDKDKGKQCQIIFHNAKFILWYIQLSLWYVYFKLCINICHYFFFNYLSGDCITITMKMHGSNLIHFTFMAPAVKLLHLMRNIYQ